MMHHIRGVQQQLFVRGKQVYAAILVVIVIAAVFSFITISTMLSSVATLDAQQLHRDGSVAKFNAETCLSEGLLQISRNDAYIGTTLTLTNGTCDITLSSTTERAFVTTTGHYQNAQHQLSATFLFATYKVERFDEKFLTP